MGWEELEQNPFLDALDKPPVASLSTSQRYAKLLRKGATFGVTDRDIQAEGLGEHVAEFAGSIPTIAATTAVATPLVGLARLGPVAGRLATAGVVGAGIGGVESAVQGDITQLPKETALNVLGEAAFIGGGRLLRKLRPGKAAEIPATAPVAPAPATPQQARLQALTHATSTAVPDTPPMPIKFGEQGLLPLESNLDLFPPSAGFGPKIDADAKSLTGTRRPHGRVSLDEYTQLADEYGNPVQMAPETRLSVNATQVDEFGRPVPITTQVGPEEFKRIPMGGEPTQLPIALEAPGRPSAGKPLPQNVSDAFVKTADYQRGAPEEAMLKIQDYHGGGVINSLTEHVGDIIHRMTHKAHLGIGYSVKSKVDDALRWLSEGFPQEFEQNIVNNARYFKRNPAEHKQTLTNLMNEYADTHSQNLVYNRPQWLARQAAVELGHQNFDKARAHLQELKKIADLPIDQYERAVLDYDPREFPATQAIAPSVQPQEFSPKQFQSQPSRELGTQVIVPLTKEADDVVKVLMNGPSPRQIEMQFTSDQLEFFGSDAGRALRAKLDATVPKRDAVKTSEVVKLPEEAVQKIVDSETPVKVIDNVILGKTKDGKLVDFLGAKNSHSADDLAQMQREATENIKILGLKGEGKRIAFKLEMTRLMRERCLP